MPFPFLRPDGPPRGPPYNPSFSSFVPSSSSYSPDYTLRTPRNASFNRSTAPLSRIPAPPPPPPTTVPPSIPDPELPSVVNLRTAGTPPPLVFLPTPPGSDIRPLLTQSTDENPPFYSAAKPKSPTPHLLHSITPDTLQSLRESCEAPLILFNVTAGDFADWEARFPGIDESNARYEYDGLLERMIVKCMAGPVHDSFPIYFFRAINDGLNRAGPDCRRGLQMCTSTDFYGFKGEYEDTLTRKSPDAYITVAGALEFPSVVVEVGWAESMEDLMDDARLWLLGTGGQTKVVIIVKFNEGNCGNILSSSPSPSSSSPTPTGSEASDAGGDHTPDSTEESRLLADVTSTTRLSILAETLRNLHLRGELEKPLLGAITATFHVFRRTTEDTVYEDFTTTVLPAPDADINPPQTYALTLEDLYGGVPVPAGADAQQQFVMDMDDFRRDIAHQVPKMEVKRSLERAKAILAEKGFWLDKATFAGAKKAKRKRGEECDSLTAYQDKRLK